MRTEMTREQATALAERIRKDMGLGDPIVEFEQGGMVDPTGPVRVAVRRVQAQREGDWRWQVCLEQASTGQCFDSEDEYAAVRAASERP